MLLSSPFISTRCIIQRFIIFRSLKSNVYCHFVSESVRGQSLIDSKKDKFKSYLLSIQISRSQSLLNRLGRDRVRRGTRHRHICKTVSLFFHPRHRGAAAFHERFE